MIPLWCIPIAVITGNTMVLKPSERDPGAAMILAELACKAGFPPGVLNIVHGAHNTVNYILDNPEWKEDRIPEVFEGKNVYDFIDPDIEAKLAALEEEEERLEAEGFYDESDDDVEDAEEADIRYKAELIREKRQLIRNGEADEIE